MSAKEFAKIKVVFIGDTSVGKTALFYQFQNAQFQTDLPTTVGGACANVNVDFDNDSVPLMIWDTAGQEQLRAIVPMYIQRSAFILLVYDISNRLSFESLESWVNLVTEKAECWTKIILIGNKSDLEDSRQVEYFEGSAFAEKNRLLTFLETSAKTKAGVKDILNLIAKTSKSDRQIQEMLTSINQEVVISTADDKKKRCC
ncbi:Ras-related protein Rab-2A [Tritrichomonas foetus]|uniref:Ras-related protein Rab-2A n=1 Tax=Tritrichomonas foetus TaxID=1144522 RepID=A0A1J4JET9_9EUKA|nr:Ras-related protein Rab-2A [Tritrichomonas foetus]|eukprot:OHS96163.1 Ras-related protein Rab-2A [Tritrichomonas foetus]